jgi:hypothetical protein
MPPCGSFGVAGGFGGAGVNPLAAVSALQQDGVEVVVYFRDRPTPADFFRGAVARGAEEADDGRLGAGDGG